MEGLMATKDKSKIADRAIFALDIGTRSIIGIVGIVEDDRLKVIAIEREEHTKRAMIDGQIEDIDQVAKLASLVKNRLEDKLGFALTRVCIAAAGRALITQRGAYELQLPETRKVDPELISRLEAGAISQAEAAFTNMEEYDPDRQFFLVGYSVTSYCLDGYNISTLIDHKGKNLKAEVIATFLPSEVVESLYTTMNKSGLEVASLTLEPIAAINASIPQELRLLNLVMVDIGAGTSDIAACRDGGIVGYTMATLAGDEITEALMKQYLIDFKTAEKIKFNLGDNEELTFHDVLGFEQKVKREDIMECIQAPLQSLAGEIAKQVIDLNNGAPSAVFMAGGGSKLAGLREALTQALKMDSNRVAIAGNNFKLSAFSDEFDLNNPEYATPLGIAVSAGLNLINDSFRVTLNGRQAKLFKNGVLTVMDVLMMNGYGYQHLVSRSGQNIIVQFNGERKVIYGSPSTPAVLNLNGENSKVTEIIHAGDCIEFQPAVGGKDAEAVLSDLLEPGTVFALVNDVKVPLDTPLNTGDTIITEAYEAPPEPETVEAAETPFTDEEELYDYEDYEELSFMKDLEDYYIDETPVKKAAVPTMEGKKNTGRVKNPENQNRPAAALNAAGQKNTTAKRPPAQTAKKTGRAAKPPLTATPVPPVQEQVQEQVEQSLDEVYLTLNDAPLILPKKQDGSPYFLMDILTYSDLDFDNLSGNVVITINGRNGTFLQKLQNNDVIVIRCEERNKDLEV